MIQLSPQMRIYVTSEHVDFRNGLDGLIGIVKTQVRKDPFCGALFFFRNKSRTAFKAIMYDGQGFWLFMKRLSEGRYMYWPKATDDRKYVEMISRELSVLIWNGNPQASRMSGDWKKLDT